MDGDLKRILKESEKIISRLQLLATFFEDEVVYRIYLRSQVIHKLFDSNDELDINKLELFHLQYTETVVELLRKIKKNNEQRVSLLYDEMQLNDELITRLKHAGYSEQEFNGDKEKQAARVSRAIENLFKNLSDYSTDNPFPKNIREFGIRYSREFFHDIREETLQSLIDYKVGDVYKNAYGIIHKKLVGLQCKHDFRNSFCGGLRMDDVLLEVYRLKDTDRHFLYYPSGNLFLFCDLSTITEVDWDDTISRKSKVINDLQDKIDVLKSKIELVKTNISAEVKQLLLEYCKKTEDVSFLQNLSNVDVEANMLKSMLDTESM